MQDLEKHLINVRISVREVLSRLDGLGADAILFLTDDSGILKGSLTDGDIRRGLIKGLGIEDSIDKFTQGNPKYFKLDSYDLMQMQQWRLENFKIIPVVDHENVIVDIINFRVQNSYLPIDAVIMAGGEGSRLRPLTLKTPKPLLKIGGKPIVEYNIERLRSFGIRNLTLSIKYLGHQLKQYFGDGSDRQMIIKYVEEDVPLGTIGAVASIESFDNDFILVMNSDLLTDINFEDMFQKLIDVDGDMVVATTPYEVNVPYGVIETDGDSIIGLKEKPTYTYYSNAGIYIFKKEHYKLIPKHKFFNATDLMEALYTTGKNVIQYPILGYWLDIGKPHDFEKAQKDILHLEL